MPTRIINPSSRDVQFDFNKDTVDSVLQIIVPGETIIKISVQVTEAFEAIKVVTIGVPADHNKFVGISDTDLTIANVYEVSQYYTVVTSETLSFFASGASATGAGKIFVEFL